jgi:hypothetical protein
LARFYNVPVDQLLPRDTGPDPGLLSNGAEIDLRAMDDVESARVDDRVAIDLTRLESLAVPERELLSRYLGMIQVQRHDFEGGVLTIRQEDLRAIACLFETTSDNMRRRLGELGLRR